MDLQERADVCLWVDPRCCHSGARLDHDGLPRMEQLQTRARVEIDDRTDPERRRLKPHSSGLLDHAFGGCRFGLTRYRGRQVERVG